MLISRRKAFSMKPFHITKAYVIIVIQLLVLSFLTLSLGLKSREAASKTYFLSEQDDSAPPGEEKEKNFIRWVDFTVPAEVMLKAGADAGATGENPAIVGSRRADIIIGPMGIVIADSLMGEITPDMAVALGQSQAKKVLIPVNRCQHFVVGCQDLPLGDYVKLVVEQVEAIKRGDC